MKLFNNSDEIDHILDDIQRVAGLLFYKGWSERNAGNISIKLPESIDDEIIQYNPTYKLDGTYSAIANQCFYITGLGRRMHDIANSTRKNGLIVKIDNTGTSYKTIFLEDDEVRPSSELPSHLGIHSMIAERGSDEIVVMHTHATELITLTQNPNIKSSEELNNILWRMHPETVMFIPKGAGFVPYMLPGTKEIALATIKALQDHNIVVWEKHGVFGIGKGIIETFDKIDIASKSAKIWLDCKSAGFEPEGISKDQLDELRKLSSNF